MARTYLVRGMLAGLLAGLLAVVFAKVVAEPQIARAERFEQHLDQQAGRPADQPLVARDIQDSVGLGLGVAVAGVALGGLFGLAFAVVYRRFGTTTANPTAAGLALAAFTAVFLIPFLKYPANPPSVGSPDTIGRRTILYFLAIVIAMLSVALAAVARHLSLPRFGKWNSTLVGLAVLVALTLAAFLILPGVDEVPGSFPASLLWHFRLASVGTQVVLWGGLGLIFGALTDRAEQNPTHRR